MPTSNQQDAEQVDYGASSYASRLTPRTEKGGGLGLPEKEEDQFVASKKILKLAELIRNAKSCVVLTGAGISTSAGVSDFRGPNGVWTAEKKGVPPPASKSFDNVQPTVTHMALVGLVKAGFVKLVISQNVDGLHLRSELPRDKLAELHGNLFIESCEVCGWEYLRDFDVGGISFSKTGRVCHRAGCGGCLRNNLLDWEDSLPEQEFQVAEDALRQSDLCICMGTSLRIRPASELPLLTVKNGGKLILLNLQKTPKDRHSYLRIQAPVDDVLNGIMSVLSLPVPTFKRSLSLLLVASCHTSEQELHESCSAALVPASVKAESPWQETQAGSAGPAKYEGLDASVHGQGELGEAARQRSTADALKREEGSDRQAQDEKCCGDKSYWKVGVRSTVGRHCPLPLLERIHWTSGGVGATKKEADIGQAETEGSSKLFSVIAMQRTQKGRPGNLSAEIFLTDSCSYPSKSVEVYEEEWVLEKRSGQVVKEGEWYFQLDLPIVDRDYNTQPQEAVVQELEELAKLVPANKRKLTDDDGPAAKKTPWRTCATCGKTGRMPGDANDTERETDWYCRRRCRVEGMGGDVPDNVLQEL